MRERRGGFARGRAGNPAGPAARSGGRLGHRPPISDKSGARYAASLIVAAPVTRAIRSGARSAGLQAFGLVQRRGLWTREEVDQRLCRNRLL